MKFIYKHLMELREISYFVTIVDAGSLSAATNILHVSQPALTHAIQLLETEYGQKLLTRGRHGVVPTEAGSYFYEQAKIINHLCLQTDEQMKSYGSQLVGDIHFGTAETDQATIIFQTAQSLLEQYPRIKLRVYNGSSFQVEERVRNGIDDIGLVYGLVDLSIYNEIIMPEQDRWCVLMRTDSPLAEKDFICREDLIDQKLIIADRAMHHPTLQDWFHTDIQELKVTATFSLGSNVGEMVEAEIGYALIYEGLEYQTPRHILKTVPLKDSPKETAPLIWRKAPLLSSPANALLGMIKTRIR